MSSTFVSKNNEQTVQVHMSQHSEQLQLVAKLNRLNTYKKIIKQLSDCEYLSSSFLVAPITDDVPLGQTKTSLTSPRREWDSDTKTWTYSNVFSAYPFSIFLETVVVEHKVEVKQKNWFDNNININDHTVMHATHGINHTTNFTSMITQSCYNDIDVTSWLHVGASCCNNHYCFNRETGIFKQP